MSFINKKMVERKKTSKKMTDNFFNKYQLLIKLINILYE